jgi:hypothetical protein
MYVSIQSDKADFVRTLIDNGLMLSKFLTYRCLIKLYNDVSFDF